jgi:hypothetical protein
MNVVNFIGKSSSKQSAARGLPAKSHVPPSEMGNHSKGPEMKTSFLFVTIASALLIVGCGDTTNVVNNYYEQAADGGTGNTTVNNTTSSTSSTVTNNYFGGSLDGGTANAVDTIPAFAMDTGSTAIDTQPQTPPISLPAASIKPDTAILDLVGGERLLDGTGSQFAWVSAKGELLTYDLFTRTQRQLNSPMSAGSNFYDAIISLAMDTWTGKVAWVRKEYKSNNTVCMHIMVDTTEIENGCFLPSSSYVTIVGAVAFSNRNLVWTISTDADGRAKTFWYNVLTSDVTAKTQVAIEDNDYPVSNLRIVISTLGYMAHGQYMTWELGKDTTAPSSKVGLTYIQSVDFSSASMLMMGGYMGDFWVGLTDRNGNSSRPLDSAGNSARNCTRCTYLGYDDSIAIWSVEGGIRYQLLKVDGSKPQFIAGASEFVPAGTNIYYIGPDMQGKQHLYSRDYQN